MRHLLTKRFRPLLLAIGLALPALLAWRFALDAESEGRVVAAPLTKPEDVRPAAARLLPGMAYVGAGSCAAAACHGGRRHAGADYNDAHTRWITSQDKHGRAYQVLSEDRSKQIFWRLVNAGQELDEQAAWKQAAPQRDNRCLICHAVPHADPSSLPATILADGVSCEACHGPAANWRVAHTTAGWAARGPARYQRFDQSPGLAADAGPMWNTKDLVSRANICVRCHVGAGNVDANLDMDVTHDLIAAGHPRLFFEMGAFMANMPPHWNARLDREALQTSPLVRLPPAADYEARVWSIGQVVTARAAATLSVDRAKSPAHWPEFAEFDCYACHRQLKLDRPAAAALNAATPADRVAFRAARPGALVWNQWYFAGPLPLVTGDRGAFSKLLDERAAIKLSMTAPPNVDAFNDLSAECSRQIPQLRKRRWTLADVQAELRAIAVLPPVERWDEAAQRYLAVVALNQSRRSLSRNSNAPIDDQLKRLRARLKFAENTRSPMSFDPQQINSDFFDAQKTGSLTNILLQLPQAAP